MCTSFILEVKQGLLLETRQSDWPRVSFTQRRTFSSDTAETSSFLASSASMVVVLTTLLRGRTLMKDVLTGVRLQGHCLVHVSCGIFRVSVRTRQLSLQLILVPFQNVCSESLSFCRFSASLCLRYLFLIKKMPTKFIIWCHSASTYIGKHLSQCYQTLSSWSSRLHVPAVT